MSITTLTETATVAAIKSAGIRPKLEQSISESASSMTPRVALSDIPTPSTVGWAVSDTVACLVHIAVHADLSKRTVYLVIDRDNAPLTGDYKVELNSNTYTYNATAGAPADVDELLAGIAATYDVSTEANATVVSIDPSGEANAIRLRAKSSDASTYATFTVDAATSFPALADLEVYAEFDDLSTAIIYGKPAPTIAGSVANSQPYADMIGGWVQVSSVTTVLGGDVPSGGYLERIDLAGHSAIMAQVNGTLSDTLSGVIGYAGVSFMPSRES